jgi:hypothetical protein
VPIRRRTALFYNKKRRYLFASLIAPAEGCVRGMCVCVCVCVCVVCAEQQHPSRGLSDKLLNHPHCSWVRVEEEHRPTRTNTKEEDRWTNREEEEHTQAGGRQEGHTRRSAHLVQTAILDHPATQRGIDDEMHRPQSEQQCGATDLRLSTHAVHHTSTTATTTTTTGTELSSKIQTENSGAPTTTEPPSVL